MTPAEEVFDWMSIVEIIEEKESLFSDPRHQNINDNSETSKADIFRDQFYKTFLTLNDGALNWCIKLKLQMSRH